MWIVTLGTVSGVSNSAVNQSLAVLDDALAYWGRYIDFGSATIDITINFISLGPTTLAQAGTSFSNIGGNLFQADTILELQTGVDQNGVHSDIEIDVNADSINANEFYFGGVNAPNVPSNLFDLFTVLIHEVGHGLGFISFFDLPETAVYDNFVSGPPLSPVFNGPLAVAAHGGNIPLEFDPSHVSQSLNFLMTPASSPGERVDLTAAEFAILRDIGLPALLPTAGADVLFGFAAADTVSLLGGNDVYDGLGGADSINGDQGNDTLTGGSGADTLNGGSGNDKLIGGSGANVLNGGTGNDKLVIGDGGDTFNGGDGFDTLDLSGSSLPHSVDLINPGAFTSDTYISIEAVIGTSGNNQLFGDDAANLLSGEGGGDMLKGRGGIDTLLGGDGDDILEGGAGGDLLDGGAGFDTADYLESPAAIFVDLLTGLGSGGDAAGDLLSNIEKIIGSAFEDTLAGAAGAETLSGGAGNDSLLGGGDADLLIGDSGRDTLSGGAGADTLRGGIGDDSLSGGIDNDKLIGDDGRDTLRGNGGDDVLFGRDGNDRLFGGGGNDSLFAVCSATPMPT